MTLDRRVQILNERGERFFGEFLRDFLVFFSLQREIFVLMTNMRKNFLIWLIILVLLVGLFNIFHGSSSNRTPRNLAFSDFLSKVEQGQVSEVVIQGDLIMGKLSDGKKFDTYIPRNTDVVDLLRTHGVHITAVPEEQHMPSLLSILLSWFPMLLLIGVWIFFIRQMQSGGGKAMGFGKSKARLLNEKVGRITFDDVAGIEEAKQELQEIVEFLKDRQKFQRLGGRVPKGVLLVGPPGTGKTLIARAVAGEANVPFFSISGSDFVEMFVGVGASRVRDMFEQGKKNAPCIIFIDEVDAVGRHRGAGLGGGNDEREQTLNQLLVEMDGFEVNDGVILIAATNRPDVLDPALLRPGRFDRQVVVPNPDVLGRKKILEVHLRKVPLASDVDVSIIARGTPGFSGADLANLVNEAALLAAYRNREKVSMEELESAKDKVLMGTERRSMVITEEEKRLTAYHEGGHAVVALHCPDSDPIHKATIIPRGRALGMVMRLPEKDHLSVPKAKILDDVTVAMGGRIAEEMIFGKERITTGASSDIQQVTKIVRAMITEWGMSENLGFQMYGEPTQEVFLGHTVTQHRDMSEATARLVDQEVRKVIDGCYIRATAILQENKEQLHTIAQALLEYEVLSGEEIQAVLRGESLERQEGETTETQSSTTGTRKTSVPKSKKYNVGVGTEPQYT